VPTDRLGRLVIWGLFGGCVFLVVLLAAVIYAYR
jgi:hypothetical protein